MKCGENEGGVSLHGVVQRMEHNGGLVGGQQQQWNSSKHLETSQLARC